MKFRKNKPYPAYKDSGVEWIGEVPEHWEVRRLKFCMQFRTEKDVKDDFIVALENIEGWTGKYISTENKYSDEGVFFKKDDILFGKLRPYLAKVYLAPKQGIAIGDFFVFRPVENAKFLFYLLLSESFIQEVNSSTFGAKMPRVSFDFFSNLQLPVPDRLEQNQIASFLDHQTSKIDQLIQEKQELIELLKKKKTALITKCVTKGLDDSVPMKDSGVEWIGEIPKHWEVNKVAHTTYVKGRIGWQNLRSDEFSDVGCLCITGTDFKNGKIDYKNAYRVSKERYNQDPNIQLQENDLLITKDGTIGKLALLKNLKEKATLNSGIFITRPRTERYLQDFFYYVLSSDVFHKFIVYQCSGTTINHLYQNVFEKFRFPNPYLKEQTTIASFLDQQTTKIDQLINEIQDSIDLLQRYRTSLITHVVTGKIDVRDWDADIDAQQDKEAAAYA